MASRRLIAQRVLAVRFAAFMLYLFAMSCISVPADQSYKSMSFLRQLLPLQLVVSVLRLVYDGALIFELLPPPAGWARAALFVVDAVLLLLIWAAALCCLAIEDLLERSLGQCAALPAHTCGWYKAAGTLTFLGFLVSTPATFLSYTAAEAADER